MKVLIFNVYYIYDKIHKWLNKDAYPYLPFSGPNEKYKPANNKSTNNQQLIITREYDFVLHQR